MRSKRYRKKTIDVSEQFTKEEAIRIVTAIDQNYRCPSNQSLPNSRFNMQTLSGLLTFVLRKSFVVIIEDRDMIYVRLSKEPAK